MERVDLVAFVICLASGTCFVQQPRQIEHNRVYRGFSSGGVDPMHPDEDLPQSLRAKSVKESSWKAISSYGVDRLAYRLRHLFHLLPPLVPDCESDEIFIAFAFDIELLNFFPHLGN